MKRLVAFAFIATLAVPVAARAQIIDPVRPLRLTVSPIIGYAMTTTVKGVVSISTPDGTQFANFENKVGGGPTSGIAADYLLVGRLGVQGALMYTSRGATNTTTAFNGDLIPGAFPAGSMITLKAGGRFELVETESELQIYHPRAYVYGGGALMRESFSSAVGGGSAIHPGINGGIDAEIATPSRRVSVRFGVQDTYYFWRNQGFSRGFANEFTSELGTEAFALADAHNAHVFEVNAALAFHF